MTDYGVSMHFILAGQEKIPPQGTRFDVAFEENATGRLAGRLRGVDYLRMRADGFRIALSADSTAVLLPGRADRRSLRKCKSHHRGRGLRLGQHSPDLGGGPSTAPQSYRVCLFL